MSRLSVLAGSHRGRRQVMVCICMLSGGSASYITKNIWTYSSLRLISTGHNIPTTQSDQTPLHRRSRNLARVNTLSAPDLNPNLNLITIACASFDPYADPRNPYHAPWTDHHGRRRGDQAPLLARSARRTPASPRPVALRRSCVWVSCSSVSFVSPRPPPASGLLPADGRAHDDAKCSSSRTIIPRKTTIPSTRSTFCENLGCWSPETAQKSVSMSAWL